MSDSLKKDCLLKLVEKQEITAKKFGFAWEYLHQLVKQVQSECSEIEEAWQRNDRAHLQEEVGDLLHAAISLAVFCELDPHDTLLQSTQKFQKRFDAVVNLAQSDGHRDLQKQPFDILMHYWDRAKEITAK